MCIYIYIYRHIHAYITHVYACLELWGDINALKQGPSGDAAEERCERSSGEELRAPLWCLGRYWKKQVPGI